MKTDKLTGQKLDYWVARAERGAPDSKEISDSERAWGEPIIYWYGFNGEMGGTECLSSFGSASTDWHIAGPIIEREKILLCPVTQANYGKPIHSWTAQCNATPDRQVFAKTPLVAAMRAFVELKFGEKVPNVPK